MKVMVMSYSGQFRDISVTIPTYEQKHFDFHTET